MIRRAASLGCVLAAWLALVGCSDEISGTDCSVEAQKAAVYSLMSDIYLWADDVPDVNPDEYETPEALLDAMAYRKVDHWSSMQSLEPYQDYFVRGEAVSFGYNLAFDAQGRLRIAWATQDSPAGRARVTRGATILEIAGIPIETIVNENLWQDVFGPNTRGTKVVHRIQDLDGEIRDVEIAKDTINFDIVPVVKVLSTSRGKVGYVLFFSFVGPAMDQLKTAFAELKKAEVDTVVVDLRYNGGGLVSVAQYLGSLIAGPELAGKVLLRNTYNEHWSQRNSELKLTNEAEGLAAPRVVFLTSRNTASASEIVINGLKPFLKVSLVGDRTYGKPVGADTYQHCENVISPITFRSLNDNEEGDYFEGIPVDCQAPDDLDHQLGDTDEARLRLALDLIERGSCYAHPTGEGIRIPQFDLEKAREQLRRLTEPGTPGLL
jgi:C-terminal processing protease CtpA/Prc